MTRLPTSKIRSEANLHGEKPEKLRPFTFRERAQLPGIPKGIELARQRRIGMSTVLVRSEEPVTADVDGTVVMMSLDRGQYFGLDGIGTRVWDLLASPLSVAAVRDTLVAEYDVDPADCERDTVELLEDMLDEALVRVVHESSS